MSRRPGIGHNWLKKYATDLIHGYLIHDGKPVAIPRAYKKKLAGTTLAEDVEWNTWQHNAKPSDKNEPARLQAAEIIHTQRKQEQERTKCETST